MKRMMRRLLILAVLIASLAVMTIELKTNSVAASLCCSQCVPEFQNCVNSGIPLGTCQGLLRNCQRICYPAC